MALRGGDSGDSDRSNDRASDGKRRAVDVKASISRKVSVVASRNFARVPPPTSS